MVCSICHRVSAAGDHLDCLEKRRVETEDRERMERAAEKISVDNAGLGSELKALLKHMGQDRG